MASYLDDPERWQQYFIQGTGNPYAGGGTMEEQIAKQLRSVDPSKIPPAMSDRDRAIMQASQSTVGAQSQLANQQAYADMLRGTAMPQGKEVGPSGIYVNNIWDSAEAGLNRALGGYMSGKLKGQYADIDKTETEKLRGAADLEDIRTGEKKTFTAQQAAAEQAAKAAENQLDRRSREGINNASIGAANMRDVETKSYFNPNFKPTDPNSPRILTYRLKNGRLVDNNDKPVDVTGMAPYSPAAVNALTPEAAQQDAARDPRKGEGMTHPSLASRIVGSDVLQAGTGVLDPRQWLGRFGLGQEGDSIQILQRNMQEVLVDGVASDMERMTLTPVSDRDLALLREKQPDQYTQPLGWLDWSANVYGRVLSSNVDKAIETGKLTPEQGAKMIYDNQADVVLNAIRLKIPLQKIASDLGIPKEVIKRIIDDKRNQPQAQYPQYAPPQTSKVGM